MIGAIRLFSGEANDDEVTAKDQLGLSFIDSYVYQHLCGWKKETVAQRPPWTEEFRRPPDSLMKKLAKFRRLLLKTHLLTTS
jgi:hypothetical protein